MPTEQIKTLSVSAIWNALSRVIDPEFGIPIVDLGLIYKAEITENGGVLVEFTLTSPACPFTEEMREAITRMVKDVCGEVAVETRVVWRPAWSPVMMSEEARFSLGFPI